MSVPLTKRTIDHSERNCFSFSFFCDHCGKEWVSQPLPFTLGGFTTIENEDARQMLWANEHRIAFEKANLEAHFHFNNCPRCGKWVCDDCFCDEKEHSGVCKNCC